MQSTAASSGGTGPAPGGPAWRNCDRIRHAGGGAKGNGHERDTGEGGLTTFGDEFYRDILEGLAVHFDSSFPRDILATLTRHQEPRLGAALNRNQMASKAWLADELHAAVGPRLGRVLVLGGWVGALSAVLLHDRRFEIDGVTSVDIDPRCAPVAETLNGTHVRAGRFVARTADMLELDYAGADRAELVVNTSCEHLAQFARWYGGIPQGQLLVLQSNDYLACAEHVNCVPDLDAFAQAAPLSQVLFAGARRMRRYTRFMLIGRK
jgi:hypothetical protein